MRLRLGAQAAALGRGVDLHEQRLRLRANEAARVGAAQRIRPQQHARDAVDMLALQFAAQRRHVAVAAELAPHRLVEPAVQLGQAQRVLRRLRLAVEQTRRDAVAQQLAQHATLQLDDLRCEREVGCAHRLAAEHRVGALLVVDRELALQGRRDTDAVGREEARREHRQCGALLVGWHRQQRIAASAGVIAQRAHAADLARQHAGDTAHVAQRIRHRAAQHRIVFVGRELARFLARQQIARDVEALARERNDVGAEVELQRLGIDAEEVVFIGAVRQCRLAAAPCDLRELRVLMLGGERLVGVLDRPVIVGPERRVERRALAIARHAGPGEIDRRVFHHRAGDAVRGGEHRVGELLVGVDARRAEVVAQPERVAHLVHRHVFQIVVNEFLGLGACRIDVAARLEHVERVAQLLGRLIGEIAERHRMRAAQARRRGLRRLHVDDRSRQHLRAQRPLVARRQALDADVGVEDLTRSRVDVARPDRAEGRARVGHPANRRAAEVQRVPVGVVGLHFDAHRVLEADALEGLVPFEHAGRDRRAVLFGDRPVEPEGDRLDRLGQRRRRILLLETPAIDEALARRAREVVGEVGDAGREVADPCVRLARSHGLLGQLGDRIVQVHEQAARIGHRARDAGPRHARRHARLRRRDRPGRVMAQHFEDDEVGRRAHRGDRRVAGVERIALAIGALQLHAQTEHVVDEQGIGLDEHRLAIRVRLAQHAGAREQARRERRVDRAPGRRVGFGDELGVARQHLQLVVDAAEFDD